MPARPPTGLSVLVTNANGVATRWDSADLTAENVPQSLSFGTQRMQGFGQGSVTLARRIDRDYVDLNLLDEVVFVGDDGSTAYEGRINGIPRSMSGSHSIGVELQGWMGHAKDRKFTEVYVDRDLSRWQQISRGRHVALSTYKPYDTITEFDLAGGLQALTQAFYLDGGKPITEAFYDAGPGLTCAAIYTDWVGTNIAPVTSDANWLVRVYFSSDDIFTAFDQTTLNATTTSGAGYTTATTARRFTSLSHFYAVALSSGPTTQRTVHYRKVAVYGNHGLTRQGTDPGGFYASDVIRNILARFCPKLSAAGVQSTTYPIPHLAFHDRVFPYDAFLEINKYHLWDLSVWENKTAYYTAMDLTDYDWEIRQYDPGVSISLQGDDSGELANGIVVQFTNITTGQTEILTPDDYAELRDSSADNPYNVHGYKAWTEYQLSVPSTSEAALQIGRAALAEFNAPKAPGSITAQGHIRDRQGHWQPTWKVRAGDRIAITSSSSLSDRPRVVHETSYEHGSRTVTIAVDSEFKRLDAVIDRTATALAAAGLG